MLIIFFLCPRTYLREQICDLMDAHSKKIEPITYKIQFWAICDDKPDLWCSMFRISAVIDSVIIYSLSKLLCCLLLFLIDPNIDLVYHYLTLSLNSIRSVSLWQPCCFFIMCFCRHFRCGVTPLIIYASKLNIDLQS